MVVMVPKQTVVLKGKATSLGKWISPQRLSSVHKKLEFGPRVYVAPGAPLEGVKSTKLKTSGHWPFSQV